MEKEAAKEKDGSSLTIYIIVALATVIGLWFLNLLVALVFHDYNSDSGTFGDTFGIVTSLFSGLAFAGIIISIFLQSKELMLQRRQLSLQAKELHDQSIAFNEQNKVLEQQKFETTFFNLMGSIEESQVRYSKSRGQYNDTIYGITTFNPIEFKIQYDVNSQIPIYKVVEQYLLQYPFVIEYVLNSKIENKEFYYDYIRIKITHKELYTLMCHLLYLNTTKYKSIADSEFILLETFNEKSFNPHQMNYENIPRTKR